MIARDCIDLAVALTADRDAENLLEKLDKSEQLSESESKKLSKLIAGVNIAVDTIASRYYETVKTKTVTSDAEQKVPYEALAHRVYDIIEVRDSAGFKVDFYTLPFNVYLPKKSTEYTIKFKFLPEKISTVTAELELLPIVSVKAVAYLMASDIYLSRGLYDESKFWFNNFDSLMTQAISGRRVRTLNSKHLI